jgi:hypothetical protein
MAPLLAAAVLVGCPATTVHYGATPIGTPWARSGAVTANIFAYSGNMLMDGRVNGSDGLVLYTHGGTGNPAMKVLWTTRAAAARLTIVGSRLDGAGRFAQRFNGGREVPSIVRIPVPGCWRLSVRSGAARGTFVVRAVDAPATSVCQPTTVSRTTPHPRFGDVVWMPTMPTSGGIAAVRFVSTVPDVDRAVIYAGGVAPAGWSTKFLWWSPRSGPRAVLSGTRLDGIGSFRQILPAAADDEGTTFYPSIVDIPAPGCWALRVEIGGRAGLAVFKAV